MAQGYDHYSYSFVDKCIFYYFKSMKGHLVALQVVQAAAGYNLQVSFYFSQKTMEVDYGCFEGSLYSFEYLVDSHVFIQVEHSVGVYPLILSICFVKLFFITGYIS